MQPWNVVKVTAQGANEGQVGIVLRADKEKEIATVKLDLVADPVAFAFAELTVLA